MTTNSMTVPDLKRSLQEKSLVVLQERMSVLQRECADLETQNDSLNDELKKLEAPSEVYRGLRTFEGEPIPCRQFSTVLVEGGKSKATATFALFNGTFSISIISDDKQEILKISLDVSKAPKLWEIEKHLVYLEINNNPQSVMLDIVLFKHLDDFRNKVLCTLKARSQEGFFVTLTDPVRESSENSPTVKAFNRTTSEIYFELKWEVGYSKQVATLCHNFRFKCTPQERPDNTRIHSLVSNLKTNLFWSDNHIVLHQLWVDIYKCVKENSGL